MIVDLTIRPMLASDWPEVAEIYLQGINTGNATFQTEIPGWSNWDQSHSQQARLVAQHNSKLLGWVALAPISARAVYRGVAEVSIYVAQQARQLGVGHHLLAEIIKLSEANGYWTLQAGILAENQASLSLHRNLGFREVGYRERMGQLNGVWRNVILLERRRANDAG